MKHVVLSAEESALLRQSHKSASTHRERQRAHAVLLCAKGYRLDQLSDIFEADRDTISLWIDDWQEQGLAGLSDAPRSGRPSKLDDTARALITQALQAPTPNLKPLLLEKLKKGESK